MGKSTRENDPLRPGPLRLRETVRTSLFALHHLTQVSLSDLSPPRQLRPARLDVTLVEQVEQALKCRLPDELLACLANEDDELAEFGFDLGKIADYAAMARKRGCPKDLVAVGRHPDGHAFYCVSKKGPRDRSVQIADLDNFDGSLNWYDLGAWLGRVVEGRQEFLAEQYAELKGWTPSVDDVSNFKPLLE